MKEFRAAIIRMHERGTGNSEIGRLLGKHEATVRKAIKRFEETGSNNDRQGRGRKRTARTPENIRKIKAKIKRNPSSRKNYKRKLVKAYGISKRYARNILIKDLE